MHTLPVFAALSHSAGSLLLALELDVSLESPEMRRYMGVAVACLFGGIALRVTCGLFNMLLKPGAMIPSPNILRCLVVVILAWAINGAAIWGLAQVSPQYFAKLLEFAAGRNVGFKDLLGSVYALIFGVGLLQILLQALLIRMLLGARFGYGIVVAMLNIEVTVLLLAILGTAFSVWLAR